VKYGEGVLAGGKLPPGWKEIVSPFWGFWQNDKRGLRIIADIDTYPDGKKWIHLSMSSRRRIPTYEEMAYMKKHWLGENLKAIMVFPEKAMHVNYHPRCLHMFHCVDGDGLPEFSANGKMI
jgi:hypothetical protein